MQMQPSRQIREIQNNELTKALALVNTVFERFVATDYSPQGQKTFSDYLLHKLADIENEQKAGTKRLWGCWQGGELAGVLATRGGNHISLLFVAEAHHRKGIARALFEELREQLATDPSIREITVNSSPYAVEVYRRLGFEATDTEQEKDGIRYIPMRCAL